MPSKKDFEFGKIAVKSKFINKDQLRESLFFQMELERTGIQITIDRVLFLCGHLSESQVSSIQNQQKRRIIFCQKCNAKLNTWGFDVGSRALCKACSSIHVVQSDVFPQYEKNRFSEISKKIETIKTRLTSDSEIMKKVSTNKVSDTSFLKAVKEKQTETREGKIKQIQNHFKKKPTH